MLKPIVYFLIEYDAAEILAVSLESQLIFFDKWMFFVCVTVLHGT
jgi:hypothetical protein